MFILKIQAVLFDIINTSENNGKENLMKKINYAEMAQEIYEWCKARELWEDTCIYFDFKAWATWSKWKDEQGKEIADGLYEYDKKLCTDYFEYGNPHTLSMSFEGSLYYVFNYYWEDKLYSKWHDEFYNLIGKYGCYFELGHAWNLSVVED